MTERKINSPSDHKTSNNSALSSDERYVLWNRIENTLRRNRMRSIYSFSGIAAVFLLLAGVAVHFLELSRPNHTSPDIKIIAENARILNEKNDEISFIEVSKNKNEKLSLEDRNVIYDTDSVFSQQKSGNARNYSTVFVPYGKRLEVKLPDDTRVWLNAGSQLTFPNSFGDEDRIVYLSGEGYFDVTHTGNKFKVFTDHNSVDVLGTTFNLSSYPEDQKDVVELLTGSISFQSQEGTFQPITLKPLEELEMNLKTNHIQIRRGSTGNGILWTKKQLELENISLSGLFKKLERIYNVKIHTDNLPDLSSVLYSGRLDMNRELLPVLNNIYELNNYKIMIKEKEVFIVKK